MDTTVARGGFSRASEFGVDDVEPVARIDPGGVEGGDHVAYLAQGDAGAARQRDLFATEAERLAGEIDELRFEYLRCKTDYWDVRARGDVLVEESAARQLEKMIEVFTG